MLPFLSFFLPPILFLRLFLSSAFQYSLPFLSFPYSSLSLYFSLPLLSYSLLVLNSPPSLPYYLSLPYSSLSRIPIFASLLLPLTSPSNQRCFPLYFLSLPLSLPFFHLLYLPSSLSRISPTFTFLPYSALSTPLIPLFLSSFSVILIFLSLLVVNFPSPLSVSYSRDTQFSLILRHKASYTDLPLLTQSLIDA